METIKIALVLMLTGSNLLNAHEGSEPENSCRSEMIQENSREHCLNFIRGLKRRIDNYTIEEFKKFLHAIIDANDYEETIRLIESNLESGILDKEDAIRNFPEEELRIRALFAKAFVFAKLQLQACKALYEELNHARVVIDAAHQKKKLLFSRSI